MATLSEEEFRALTVKKYQKHFDHVYELHLLAQDAIASYKGFSSSAYQESLSLIFPKAYKSFDAVRRLCEVASCEDAGVILRSLLNLLVVTRWITLDQSKRASRYLHWFWVAMYSDLKQPEIRVSTELASKIKERYLRVRHQFLRKNPKHEDDLVNQWYQPEVNNLSEMFEAAELKGHYQGAYKPLSGIEHSDAAAYAPMLERIESETGERSLNVQNDRNVPSYLRNAFQYFGDVFVICNKSISLADATKLGQIIADGQSFYAADMRARGMTP